MFQNGGPIFLLEAPDQKTLVDEVKRALPAKAWWHWSSSIELMEVERLVGSTLWREKCGADIDAVKRPFMLWVQLLEIKQPSTLLSVSLARHSVKVEQHTISCARIKHTRLGFFDRCGDQNVPGR
jgi:hypothetical protein